MHDKRGREMLEARERGDVYIVEKIAKGLDEFALLSAVHHDLTGQMNMDTALSGEQNDQSDLSHSMNDVTQVDRSQLQAKLYKLWHRRFAHLGPAKLRDLHKITTLEKPIPIVHNHDDVCEVCALIKFNNHKGHKVSERKAVILNLVSIDICGPLPLSRDDYVYFLKIVDNHSRKT